MSSNPIRVIYSSLPVEVPSDFLAPLLDPSVIQVERIDFENSPLPEYKGLYAVVLDNVLSPAECNELIHYAEMSAGGHRDNPEVINNGWKPAMVNVGMNYEMLDTKYRNSDRIIWDDKEVTKRLWNRVLQGEGIKEYLLKLEGRDYRQVIKGEHADKAWISTEQGMNERMRFLKYGAGQFFKEHCDSAYISPNRREMTHYTVHFYFNDSAQAIGIPEPREGDNASKLVDSPEKPAELLRGGATTFHSTNGQKRIDVDPKAGRVLIFQHRRLLHSGDTVQAGIKYTMRSDLMYKLASKKELF